ncbi:hypothetical protein Btru_043612 [Bulinus truncatus]|nr:hypothetical protein Btru_043612 [Bulinus truncatus]
MMSVMTCITVMSLCTLHLVNSIIQSADGSSLPIWLQFDDNTNVLQGIPAPKNAGQLFLEITAKGRNSQTSVTFTLYVRDVASHTLGAPLRFQSSGPEFVHCKASEPETVATIIIDVDLDAMPVAQRMSLLHKFTSHMLLHEDMVKMIPVGTAPLHDNSALVSGTGDSINPRTQGSFISWPVGCGQVKEGHFSVLQKLDEDSSSGKIAQVLGYPVIGWRVTNSHLLAPSRKRRQVQATPTPAMTPIAPSTTHKASDKTDEHMEKLTHAVIDKETPTLIQPTATQPFMPKTALPTPMDERPSKPILPPKVMPTETTTVKMPAMEKTTEIKPAKTVKDGDITDLPKPATCVPGKEWVPVSATQHITIFDGQVYNQSLENNLFKDCDILVSTRKLQVNLFKETNKIILPDEFLQFDAKKQHIFAFPINKTGQHNFTLSAKKGNQMGFINYIVEVKSHKRGSFSQKLGATIDHDYDELMKNTTEKIQIAHRLASVFGKEMKDFHFHEITVGSVIYTWSFPNRNCKQKDIEEIKELVDKLINEDNTLNQEAVEKMKPYKLIGAEAVPINSCKDKPNFPSRSVKPILEDDEDEDKETKDMSTEKMEVQPPDENDVSKPTSTPSDVTKDNVAKGSKGGDDDDVWITTVVPAVVIIVILLIALLVACCLYRKKRKGKMNVEEQNTFINKGAPVIFPDELEDKPSDVNKPLLVEGSPAPPPEYHRGPSESPERIFRNNGNNKAMSQNEEGIIEMPERPYNPPAPPVGGSANNRQPRPAQQPFSQPPQILP